MTNQEPPLVKLLPLIAVASVGMFAGIMIALAAIAIEGQPECPVCSEKEEQQLEMQEFDNLLKKEMSK